MISEQIKIPNKYGIHTRAAAKLVNIAKQFESQIQLTYFSQTADCKSIMSIILLGVTQGGSVQLTLTGPDEERARNAIVELIQNRFGETE